MELAAEGRTGRRLGQFSAVANVSAIIGSVAIFVGFKYFHLNFRMSYLVFFWGFFSYQFLSF